MIRPFLPTALILAFAPVAHAQVPAPPAPMVNQVDPDIDQEALSAHLITTLRSCWTIPPGFEGRRVTIKLSFTGNGALQSDPVVDLDEKSTAKSAPLVESARRAVQRCAPFHGLDQFGLIDERSYDIIVHFVS